MTDQHGPCAGNAAVWLDSRAQRHGADEREVALLIVMVAAAGANAALDLVQHGGVQPGEQFAKLLGNPVALFAGHRIGVRLARVLIPSSLDRLATGQVGGEPVVLHLQLRLGGSAECRLPLARTDREEDRRQQVAQHRRGCGPELGRNLLVPRQQDLLGQGPHLLGQARKLRTNPHHLVESDPIGQRQIGWHLKLGDLKPQLGAYPDNTVARSRHDRPQGCHEVAILGVERQLIVVGPRGNQRQDPLPAVRCLDGRFLMVPLALELEDLAREVGPVDEQSRQTGNLMGWAGRARAGLFGGVLALCHQEVPNDVGEYGHRHVKGHQLQW